MRGWLHWLRDCPPFAHVFSNGRRRSAPWMAPSRPSPNFTPPAPQSCAPKWFYKPPNPKAPNNSAPLSFPVEFYKDPFRSVAEWWWRLTDRYSSYCFAVQIPLLEQPDTPNFPVFSFKYIFFLHSSSIFTLFMNVMHVDTNNVRTKCTKSNATFQYSVYSTYCGLSK